MSLYDRYPTFKSYWASMPACIRLGQAICNYHSLSDSFLFFVVDDSRALAHVTNHDQYRVFGIREQLES